MMVFGSLLRWAQVDQHWRTFHCISWSSAKAIYLDIQQKPDMLTTGLSYKLQDIHQTWHRFVRRHQCAEGFQLGPVAVGHFLLDPEASFQIRIL
jgi:hypothetical protein